MLHDYPQHWGLSGNSLPWLRRFQRFIMRKTLRYSNTGRTRRVLLVAHNKLMLLKMKDVADVIADDENIAWHCTSSRPPVEASSIISDANKYGYTYVHPYHASIQLWDLIIVADHSMTHHFNKTIPTLLVHHGLGDAKILLDRDERYQYARRYVMRDMNTPVYTCMFESSERRREEAEKKLPSLKGHISVVGHLESDALIELDKQRADIRAKLGFSNEDIVLFIGSSHGNHSLLDSIGHEVIEEALSLPSHYKIILWAHYNHWQKKDSETRNIGNSLRGYSGDRIRICEPENDLISHIVASDIGLTDFTSVSLYFAVLNRPIVYTTIPDGVISKQSELWRLYCQAPKITGLQDLRSVIEHVQCSYPQDILESISADLVSYPGMAAQRIKCELYRLLKLDQAELINHNRFNETITAECDKQSNVSQCVNSCKLYREVC